MVTSTLPLTTARGSVRPSAWKIIVVDNNKANWISRPGLKWQLGARTGSTPTCLSTLIFERSECPGGQLRRGPSRFHGQKCDNGGETICCSSARTGGTTVLVSHLQDINGLTPPTISTARQLRASSPAQRRKAVCPHGHRASRATRSSNGMKPSSLAVESFQQWRERRPRRSHHLERDDHHDDAAPATIAFVGITDGGDNLAFVAVDTLQVIPGFTLSTTNGTAQFPHDG